MTDHAELIARAEASLEGVTDGPWVVTYERGCTYLRMGEKRDPKMCDETYYPWVPENLNDWEFFAASRDLVPDLIAALKASEARVRELEAVLEEMAEAFDEHVVLPDQSCSCHISPPCIDCEQNSFARHAREAARAALKGGDA